MIRFSTVLVAWVASTGLVWGASSKIAPDLSSAETNGNIRVIVQYSQSPSLASIPLLRGLTGEVTGLTRVSSLGGVVNGVINSVNAVVCTLPVSALENLSNDPTVIYISPDRPVAARLDYTAAAVNAASAWKANLTGKGIGVAIIDSGINQDRDLSVLGLLSRVVYTQDFVGGNGTDQYGHGTHVAGIVGANGLSSHCADCTRALIGMAPEASLINLRVLDADGQGSDSAVISAIDRAISLRKLYNIRVINLSLGRPVYESYALDPVCRAVEAAWKAGIVIVAAAGNDGRDNSAGTSGYGTIESPGNDPYVITVGAMKAMGTNTRTDDLIASYSSKGPSAIDHIVKPDLVAPGNHVVSLQAQNSTLATEQANQVPLSYYESTASNAPSTSFLMLNGTSMATPVVSGAAADLLQAHPDLTPDQVKARLMKTAYKTFPASSTAVDPVTGEIFFSQYDILTVGAGYLDIDAALKNQDIANGTALSPTAVYDSQTGNVTLSFDPASTWNSGDVYSAKSSDESKSVWAIQAVWGASVVYANLTIWGTKAVWGTSSETGFKAVWGTQSVWGTQAVWGTKAVWGTDAATSDSDRNYTMNPR